MLPPAQRAIQLGGREKMVMAALGIHRVRRAAALIDMLLRLLRYYAVTLSNRNGVDRAG